MGRLTRDPEHRMTPQGTPVASFTLAVDRDYTSRDGGEKKTDFIDVVAWRNTADFVSKWFAKGQMAVVSGRLQIRDWTDKDGGKRRSAEVVADNIYFGESKRNREDGGGYQTGNSGGGDFSRQSGYTPAPQTGSAFSEFDDDDGELPF